MGATRDPDSAFGVEPEHNPGCLLEMKQPGGVAVLLRYVPGVFPHPARQPTRVVAFSSRANCQQQSSLSFPARPTRSSCETQRLSGGFVEMQVVPDHNINRSSGVRVRYRGDST